MWDTTGQERIWTDGRYEIYRQKVEFNDRDRYLNRHHEANIDLLYMYFLIIDGDFKYKISVQIEQNKLETADQQAIKKFKEKI